MQNGATKNDNSIWRVGERKIIFQSLPFERTRIINTNDQGKTSECIEKRGGFGLVFFVYSTLTKEILTVKSPLQYDRMRSVVDEARILLTLPPHLHVISYFMVENISGIPHVFMEYVDGGNLEEWIVEGKNNDWSTLYSILIQVAEGMAYLHDHLIIHLDLKPRNILLSTNHDKTTVKITDFGIAKIFGYGSKDESNNYTRAYASPEQQGIINVKTDKGSDIFSFGITIIEILTSTIGEFKEQTKYYALLYYLQNSPGSYLQISDLFDNEIEKYILKYKKETPRELTTLVKKCLKINTSDRYQSFEDIIDDPKSLGKEKCFGCIEESKEEVKSIVISILLYLSRGISLDLLGYPGDAEKQYLQAISMTHYDFLDVINKGLSFMRLERFKEALDCFDKAIEIERDNAIGLYNKGYCLFEMGKYDESIQWFDKAIDLDTFTFLSYGSKGYALTNLHRFKEALDCFDKAIEIERDNAVGLYNKGYCLFEMGKYDESIQWFDKAIDLDSAFLLTYNIKGIALTNLHRFEEALACFDKALRLQPDFYDPYVNISSVLSNLLFYDKAIEYLDIAIRIDPSIAVSYNNKGLALVKLGRHSEAIECFDKAIEKKSNTSTIFRRKIKGYSNLGSYKFNEAHVYGSKGFALSNLHRFEEALACFDIATSLDHNNYNDWFNKGEVFSIMERYRDAIDSYDKAIALRPDYAEAYLNKGSSIATLGQYHEAIGLYDKAIALRPDYAEAYFGKGLSLSELCQYHEAIEIYDKAIALRPDYAEAYFGKGNALYYLEQYTDTLCCYDKAIALRPDYAEAYYNKSTVLCKVGKHIESIKYFDKALSIKQNKVITNKNKTPE